MHAKTCAAAGRARAFIDAPFNDRVCFRSPLSRGELLLNVECDRGRGGPVLLHRLRFIV